MIARSVALVSSAPVSERSTRFGELERGMSTGGVAYIVGGWSAEARRALAVHAAAFSVALVFAHRGSCEYIADVNVRVVNERGEEVAALDDTGPIVLLGLAAGSYRVTVSRNGHALDRTIMVGPRTRRQTVFYWNGTNRSL